jgi:hypothetical protein
MGDEISEGGRARRGVALPHDNPVEVSSSECGESETLYLQRCADLAVHQARLTNL